MNFEQRMAQIQRRSEEIIRQRKIRNRRILTICVPSVLCIGICAAVLLPAKPKAPAPETRLESVQQSQLCSIAKIQVSGDDVSRTYTEAEAVILITNQLSRYTQSSESNTAQDITTESVDDTESSQVTGAPSVSATGYTITLYLHDGTTTEYYLLGTTLKNTRTQESYPLTQKQLTELKALLGLPT